MADNEAVSIADSDSAVAGASVAITEAEEDRTLESLQGEKGVTSSSAPAVNNVVEGAAGATTSSITATDASVAGSSVAVTEVEEDILCSTTRSSTAADNNKKVILTKDSSIDLSICNQKNDDDDDDDEDANNEEDLAPMHLHALRSPAKLKGAPRSRSSSRSRPGSRKTSPQPRSNNVAVPSSNLVGTTISPSPSVGSSLDGSSTGVGGEHHHVIDPDLLLDKLGLRDLDANASHDEIQEMLKKHISSNNGLPTLNERLSEETLDDVHAFQDLVSAKKATSVDNDGDNSPGKAARDSLMRASQGPSSKILEVALDALTEEDEDD